MPLALFAGLAIISAVMLKFRPPAAAPGEAASAADGWTPPPPAGTTVSLEIDFGNGARRQFAALAWRKGMTVVDLMQAASQFRPGLRTTRRGEGAKSLLVSIDGVANQGPGGRSWLYQVNGRQGTTSYAVHPLDAGDRVLWVFSASQ